MKYQINETNQNQRLDKALKNLIPDKSRSYLSQLISDEKVLLNGNVCKPSDLVKLNDEIEVIEVESKN